MAGIALLLPNKELMEQAARIMEETDHHIIFLKQTTADSVVNEARNAINQGANIVVARGHQAMEVKNYTKVPVVEIGITAQELGLTIVRAKRILKKKHPVIGIFSWKGMLCDTKYFDELFEVEIHEYLLEDTRPWGDLIDDAINDGIEFLIGGELCVQYSNQKGLPALHLSSTGESLGIALENAENLYYMSEVEKHNYAQFSTVLDSSFSGIIKISEDGIILLINRVMAQILKINESTAIGKHVRELLEGLDQVILDRILQGEIESYSTFINAADQALVVIIEAIQVEGTVKGAIISCNRMKRLKWNDDDTMREQFLRGNVARGNLDDLSKRYYGLKQVADLAKLYAQSSSPILVEGPYGTEIDALCQGIHNYSLRKDGPYVIVNLDGINEDEQLRILFGEEDMKEPLRSGAFRKANYGTMVIYHLEKLSLAVQYRLLRVITKHQLTTYMDSETVQLMEVRIIAYTSADIRQMMLDGRFRKDLYYLFATFRLEVPPLSERKKDVEMLLDKYMTYYLNLYSRYHVLSAEARGVLLNYPWDGQELQLKAFCEHLILTVGKRVITEEYVRFLLDKLYNRRGEDRKDETKEPVEPLRNQEQFWLENMLEQYHGNRVLTAKALGISTTTLWRKMKKYNLK